MELKLCIYLLFFTNYLVLAVDFCESRDSCSKCITTVDCVWCAKDYSESRCISSKSDKVSNCKGFIQDKASNTSIIINKPFSSTVEEVIQIAPQRIKIDLRVGQPTTFKFKYKQAKDYPVDLYFLLDASKTMKSVRDVVLAQSEAIINTMKNYTDKDKIRLGLGTFVDKNALPFVEDTQNGVYSFRHQMSLNKNISHFNDLLRKVKNVTNFDTAEGGFDALAQILACKDKIGWGNHSRKIIFFITDEPYHAAGDGILAGIHQPYDGKCYTENGTYTKELEMDYPSVGMIYKLARDIEAIIIFFIKDSVDSIYKNLAEYIGGKVKSFKEGEKNYDFNAILREVYEDKTKFIKLKKSFSGILSKHVDINFTPDCSIENALYRTMPPECAVEGAKEIDITGTITLSKYEKHDNFTIDIVVDGLIEQLKLDVNVITKCDCEDAREDGASQCNNNGTLMCGLCKCNGGWFGPKCECTKNLEHTNQSSCMKDGGRVCSGNGNCVCGACECFKPGGQQEFCGKYCEFSATDCPIGTNKKLCSGPEHGKCDCGKCKCEPNWGGAACDMSNLKNNCIKNGKECNGRGECQNNTCVCDPTPTWDARQDFNVWCEYHLKLEDLKLEDLKRQCSLLEENAKCAFSKEKQCPDELSINATIVNEISDDPSWTVCEDARLAPGCYAKFSYKYDDDGKKIQLLVQEKADCLINYYTYGGITFAALIIGGICTLAGWKIVTTRRDRREYEAFLISTKQRHNSVRTNILYTSPKTTIDNPAYVASINK